MSNASLKTALILAVSVFCASIALTTSGTWSLAILSLSFLFVATHSVETRNHAFIVGLIFGFVTGGAGIFWAWSVLPFSWLGYTSVFDGAYVIGIIWFLVSLALAVPVALYSTIIWLSKNSPLFLVLASLLWPLTELARMWAFALLSYGEHSALGPHFSIFTLGYSLAENSFLLQLANPGGIFSLCIVVSILGALIAGGIFYLTKSGKHSASILILTFLILIILFPSQANVGETTPIQITAVSTLSEENDKPTQSLEELFTFIGDEYPDTNILVIPEDTNLVTGFSEVELATLIREHFPNKETLVVLPFQDMSDNGFPRSRMLSFSSQDGLVSANHKQFLMPEGEYTPYLSEIIFGWFKDERLAAYFSTARRIETVQTDFLETASYGAVEIGALTCSDSISPYFYRELGKQGATIFVNSGNQSWFNGSRLLHERLKLIAQVHAVENRSYYVSANRGSPAYIIDPDGVIIAESPWDKDNMHILNMDIEVPIAH